MSDTPNEVLPGWLTQDSGEDKTFSLAAPAEAVAADPATITAQAEAEPPPLEIEAIANVLIKFKRFWQTNAGTSNEQDAALECAEYFVGMMKNADQSK